MLVLSRKPGEKILIGKDITVTVLVVDGRGKVRLGIEAPASVQIDRQEIRALKDGEALSGREEGPR